MNIINFFHQPSGFNVLRKPAKVDLSVNDLRILVNCMKAIEFQSQADDEPYLDDEGVSLRRRLEKSYERILAGQSITIESCCS
jgi:hypothetical protein